MLKRFVAQRLSRYVKGLGAEQVSARLLAGELTLTDVEIDLSALSELLTGALPYTLDVRRVACKSVLVRVPWQAPRRHPLCVEVRDCEIQIEVRRTTDRDCLESRTIAQREWLLRGAIRDAEETLRDDDYEQRQLKDVEAKLRVGLKEVVSDGLRVDVTGLRVVLVSRSPAHQVKLRPSAGVVAPASPMESALPVLSLSVDSVTATPCTRAGIRVDRPEEVYEVSAQDPCVRLYRIVEVRCLRLSVIDSECLCPARVAVSRVRNDDLPGSLVVAEHVDSDNDPIRIWVEQRRFAGFIPQHKTRRVCPFSSEVIVGVCIGHIKVRTGESHLLAAVASIVDAIAPPYVPPEALPVELAHLHWRQPLEQSSCPNTAASLPPDTWASPGMSKKVCDHASSSVMGLGGQAFGPPGFIRWSDPVAAGGASTGLELRDQLVDLRLARRLTAHIRLHALSGEFHTAMEKSIAVLASVESLALCRDSIFALEAFECRCLRELGLLHEAGVALPDNGASDMAGNGVDSPSEPQRCTHGGVIIEPGQPMFCLNEVELGSARVCWQTVASALTAMGANGTTGSRPLLRLEVPSAPVLVFRWKELPPAPATCGFTGDTGWQPVEGCVHGVRVVLDTNGWREMGGLIKRAADVCTDSLVLPPFDTGWCRIGLHGLELEVPAGTGVETAVPAASPSVMVTVPAVLLTSVPGLGELFRVLEVLPPAPTWYPPGALATQPATASSPCAAATSAGMPHTGFTLAAAAAARSATHTHVPCVCACGCEIAEGAVRLATTGFVPVRGRLSMRDWAARQGIQEECGSGSSNFAGFVVVRHEEFVELVRGQIAAEAGALVLPELRELRAAAGNGHEISLGTGPKSKRKKRAGTKRKGKGPSEGEVEGLAARWAALQETVRRLQAERRELELRAAALWDAADAEVRRSEERVTGRERELAGQIAAERAHQAELSAEAEEQRNIVSQLLRDLPSCPASVVTTALV